MSLYKRKDSPYWWVAFMKDRRRVQFSTGTTDEAEAKQLELAFRRRLHGLKKERFISIIEGLVGNDGETEASKADFLRNLPSTWEKAVKLEGRALSDNTMKRRHHLCFRFWEWARHELGATAFLSGVDAKAAWDFLASCKGTAKTKQNICGELSAIWETLIRRGLIKDNPWKHTRPKSNTEEQKTGRSFTAGEVRAILRASEATPWLHTAILIALYTGLRQGDVLSLKWECVDLRDGLISLMPSKTKRFKRKVSIPIHPALAAHLSGLQGKREGTVIKGAPALHPERAWQRALKKARIQQKDGTLLTFHNLRHTFATWVREAGADKGEQMLLGGWSEVATANLYDHDLTSLRNIVAKLPGV